MWLCWGSVGLWICAIQMYAVVSVGEGQRELVKLTVQSQHRKSGLVLCDWKGREPPSLNHEVKPSGLNAHLKRKNA